MAPLRLTHRGRCCMWVIFAVERYSEFTMDPLYMRYIMLLRLLLHSLRTSQITKLSLYLLLPRTKQPQTRLTAHSRLKQHPSNSCKWSSNPLTFGLSISPIPLSFPSLLFPPRVTRYFTLLATTQTARIQPMTWLRQVWSSTQLRGLSTQLKMILCHLKWYWLWRVSRWASVTQAMTSYTS